MSVFYYHTVYSASEPNLDLGIQLLGVGVFVLLIASAVWWGSTHEN